METNMQSSNRFREVLLEMRGRVLRQRGHIADAMDEATTPPGQESAAPVHLADTAPGTLDADAEVLAVEGDLLLHIDEALERLTTGEYGRCRDCGATIAPERLEALPFADRCVACAQADATVDDAEMTGDADGVDGPEDDTDGRLMRLTGFEAVEYAEHEGLSLNKSADNIDDEALGISVAEARAIAEEDPDQIWLDVAATEYWGRPRNMEPGTGSTARRKRAGQYSDELLPGQHNGGSQDPHAAGTPGGGLASGGLAGTNTADGAADEAELEDAMGSGVRDHSGDRIADDEPQSGRSGGAVGGTPAGKRAAGK